MFFGFINYVGSVLTVEFASAPEPAGLGLADNVNVLVEKER
jgi:hypothetical protein